MSDGWLTGSVYSVGWHQKVKRLTGLVRNAFVSIECGSACGSERLRVGVAACVVCVVLSPLGDGDRAAALLGWWVPSLGLDTACWLLARVFRWVSPWRGCDGGSVLVRFGLAWPRSSASSVLRVWWQLGLRCRVLRHVKSAVSVIQFYCCVTCGTRLLKSLWFGSASSSLERASVITKPAD